MTIGPEELSRRFTYYPPPPENRVKHETLRAAAREFADLIDSLCPDGREKRLSLDRLDETLYWANGAVARPEGADVIVVSVQDPEDPPGE